MPLVPLSGQFDAERPHQPVLVFADRDRSMGLVVDEIVDIVEDRLEIELSGARPGLLGTAVIAGKATDVIDTGYWLTQAWHDWFRNAPHGGWPRQRPAGAGGGGQRLLPPTAGADAGRRRLSGDRGAERDGGAAAARGRRDVRRDRLGHRDAGNGRPGLRPRGARIRSLGGAAA